MKTSHFFAPVIDSLSVETSLPNETTASYPQTLIFIDAGVEDYESLVNGVVCNSTVIVLDSNQDGVTQITKGINNHSNIAQIHIVSHGSPGCLYLGNSQLSLDTLSRYAQQLKNWAIPSLVLYGCNVASGDAGAEFLERLHKITGAGLAASCYRVGNVKKGGTWTLDYHLGELVDNQAAFLETTRKTYSGVFNVSFDPPTDYATGGGNPFDVLTADFNGDGILDLITVNSGSSTIAVLLGDGLGGFGSPSTFSVTPSGSAQPIDIAVGDFNKDGNLDVVTANFFGGGFTNSVSVLFGDGSGGVGSRTILRTARQTYDVGSGDLNNDGNLDIIVADRSSSDVSVFLGNGSGGFGGRRTFDLSPNFSFGINVILGDVNNDGNLDLVASNSTDNNVSVLLGDGTGSLASPTTFSATQPLDGELADLNGDGNLDLVTVNGNNTGLVFLGDGSGDFTLTRTLTTRTRFAFGVAIGDINGDDIPDIVLGDTVFLGDGLGGFGNPTIFPVPTNTLSVDIGDFNSDGKLDWVTVSSDSDRLRVFLNTTSVNQSPIASDDNASTDEDTSFTTGNVLDNDSDLNGDTLTVTEIDVTGTLGLVTNNGDGTFSYDPNGQFESLAVGETATDTFTYTVSDGSGGTDTATVTITIEGVNDNLPPVAINDDFFIDENTIFLDGNVFADNENGADNDPDGDTLTLTEVNGDPDKVNVLFGLSSGALIGFPLNAPNGSFVYDTNGRFESLAVGQTARDTFTYTISDGNGETDTATVRITIAGVNDAPIVASPISVTATEEDNEFSIDLLDGATDVDNGTVLSVTNVAQNLTLALYNFEGRNRASLDPDALTVASSFSSPVNGTLSGDYNFFVNEDIDGVSGGPITTGVGWSSRSERESNDTYFEFTITPEPGTTEIDFSSLTFDTKVFDTLGGTTTFDLNLSWSVDGFASIIDSISSPSISGFGVDDSGYSSFEIDLSALETQTEAVTFRIDPLFGSGSATNGAGGQRRGSIDNVVLIGTATAVDNLSGVHDQWQQS